VIKVLEHESKLYNFEKNLLKYINPNGSQLQGANRTVSYVYERPQNMRPY